MVLASIAVAVLALAGATITTLQTLLAAIFRRRFFGGGLCRQAASQPGSRPAALPRVSILKPVCGLEDELEENLASFARLTGVDYEVILSVADPADAALRVIERVIAAHPAMRWKLVVGGDPRWENGNRKVARLIAATRHAQGDILLISDANVRVEPGDVGATVAAFAGARTGCVSNVFTGSGARTFGASMECLHLLSFVVPGSVIAAFADVPCVVGKSMAISRRALQAVGGFEAFANVLAEDQAIGLAVRNAGYDVVLSPVVVRNVVIRRTLRRAMERQVRWNKIRFAFSPAAYSAEFLVNPLPFAILAAALSTFAMPLVCLAAYVAVLRIAQVATLRTAMQAPLHARDLLFVPLLDLLQFGAQFVPYINDRVAWRGYTARIGPNTILFAER